MNGGAGDARNSYRREHPPPQVNDSERARTLDAGGQRRIARLMHERADLIRVLICVSGNALKCGAPDLKQWRGAKTP